MFWLMLTNGFSAYLLAANLTFVECELNANRINLDSYYTENFFIAYCVEDPVIKQRTYGN